MNQYGFRKTHSCETKLILVVEDLAMNLYHRDQVEIIKINFGKAMDKVPNHKQIAVLWHSGK